MKLQKETATRILTEIQPFIMNNGEPHIVDKDIKLYGGITVEFFAEKARFSVLNKDGELMFKGMVDYPDVLIRGNGKDSDTFENYDISAMVKYLCE